MNQNSPRQTKILKTALPSSRAPDTPKPSSQSEAILRIKSIKVSQTDPVYSKLDGRKFFFKYTYWISFFQLVQVPEKLCVQKGLKKTLKRIIFSSVQIASGKFPLIDSFNGPP